MIKRMKRVLGIKEKIKMDEEKKLLVRAIYNILNGKRIGPGHPLLYPEELKAQSLIAKYCVIGTPEYNTVFGDKDPEER